MEHLSAASRFVGAADNTKDQRWFSLSCFAVVVTRPLDSEDIGLRKWAMMGILVNHLMGLATLVVLLFFTYCMYTAKTM